MKVLVTYGGTTEKIDGVRSIRNSSTGSTGKYIVKYLTELDIPTDYYYAKSAGQIPSNNNSTSFESFDDLFQLLKRNSQNYTHIIHCAAVSDYKLDKIIVNNETLENADKIPSGNKIQLELVPTEKIIDQIKQWNPNVKLIGFKLTNKYSEKEIQKATSKVFANSNCDYLVQNDLQNINGEKHLHRIYNSKQILNTGNNKLDLAKSMAQIIKGEI